MNKKFLSVTAVSLCTALSITACGTENKNDSGKNTYTPGTYQTTSEGFGGTITVDVTVNSEKLEQIKILSSNETAGIGSKAIEQLPQIMIDANSADVDGISGATISSTAIKQAVANALKQASGATDSKLAMKAGTYTASAKGNNGDVKVSVEVSESEIKSIQVVEHSESKGIYNVPFEQLPKQIIENQSLKVDTISGATVSSNALISAVTDCVKQAGGDVNILTSKEIASADKTEEEFKDYNVVVVGGGLSGLTAAISATQSGAKVALIEKQSFLGGTTMLATGTIRYADKGDGEAMVQSILDEGADFRKEGDKYPLTNYLDAIGDVSYKSTAIYNAAGLNMGAVKDRPYVQKPESDGKAGYLYIEKLEAYFEELGGTIYKSTPATSLIQDKAGTVTGVISDTTQSKKTFHASSVILACGDFARNLDLASKYDKLSTGNFTGTAVGNTGDGLTMAIDAGAAIWDDMFSMGGAFVFNPYDSFRAGQRDSETLNNSLLVSLQGERLIDESASPKFVQAVYKNETEADSCWDIMDSEIVKDTEQNIDDMIAGNGGARVVVKADTIEELAKLMNVDEKVLVKTVNRYNELCKKGQDDDFGKSSENMVPIAKAPFYAARAYCVTRGIAGGIMTNTSAEVLKADGKAIPGLYASGAIASRPFYGGAYQGAAAFSVAGNMGYIAGEHAAKTALK